MTRSTSAAGPTLRPRTRAAPDAASLRRFALAAAATIVQHAPPDHGSGEVKYLLAHLSMVAPQGGAWHSGLADYLKAPGEGDRLLLTLGRDLRLTLAEQLAVAFAAAVEDDAMAGRAVAFLQAPVAGSRPTLALLATIFATCDACAGAFDEIAVGRAQQTGVLVLQGEGPLPERSLSVPVPLAMALRGVAADWPTVDIDDVEVVQRITLPRSTLEDAARHARTLSGQPSEALVVRSGSPNEARAAAAAVCAHLHRTAAIVHGNPPLGLGPWLALRSLLPVFCVELAPGEHHRLPDIPGYEGPVLAVCGPDGTVEAFGGASTSWQLATPDKEERTSLWERALGDPQLSRTLASDHRHSSSRITELARTARHIALLDGRLVPRHEDVTAAARAAPARALGALAQPITDSVADEALVVPAGLRAELQALLARCRARESLATGLGPAARTRYHPGVRTLFVGPSGTGKTLAASWLATCLGVPLHRVDLAAVTSKYIGETEKHLAQLLARAEHAEVALLFDEADSLFGKRTDVKDSNDRFANAQTNYLLQRIETFDGIAILTSNSRGRFDSAFCRRLDAIIDFPAPGPDERRALWLAHLGTGHSLSAAEINQLAAIADLSGGHIRNAVFTAAAAGRSGDRLPGYADVARGVTAEYRKLGRQAPAALSGTPRT